MSLSTEKAIKQDQKRISGFHQDLELLRNASLLRGLDHECLKLLAMLCQRMEYSAGDQLVSQDEDNDSAFLITSGRLDALRTEGEEHHIISKYGPGQFIYGCTLLGRILPPFTLKAKEATSVLCIRRKEFQKTVQQFPNSITRITDNLVSELVVWDRKLLKKDHQGNKLDYHAVGISLL